MSVPAATAYTPPSGRGIEDSVRHRVAVLANTAAAFIAYATVDPDATASWPIVLTAMGSAFSHWRRGHRNLLVKWLLAAGMLYALWISLGNLVRGQIDPRLSLAQLLMSLQVLNSFDLPRRRNLRVALLVASIMIVVSGTLSRTMDFGLSLFCFCASLLWALLEGTLSETGVRLPSWRQAVAVLATSVVAMGVFALPFFVLAPRKARTVSGTQLPLSLAIPLPDSLDPHVRDPESRAGGATDPAGHTRRAYGGFSEHLDLSVRMIPSDDVVLRVKCDRPDYWRGMAFDIYDGRGWRMSDPENVKPLPGSSTPFRVSLPKGQHGGERVVQTFYVERDGSNLVFSAWAAREVYFPAALLWRDSYDGLRSPVSLEKDMYYSVVSEPPSVDRRALALQRARPLDPWLRGYLKLPPISARVRQLTNHIVQGAHTPFATMNLLQNYLSTTYAYRSDIADVPPGAEWVDQFLFVERAGVCEQFATSLAVMGRLRGIPTRLVTGYAPGAYNPFTGYYDVKSRDAHAWVEAWIPNQGWVPFDATPGSGIADEDDDVQFGHAREVAASLYNMVAPLFAAHRWLQALVVLAVLSLFGLGVRAWRRWSPPARSSTAVYRRLRARMARRGVKTGPCQTPRDWLEAAASVPAVSPALSELERFVARYEAVRFGGNAAEEPATAADLAGLARDVERKLAAVPSNGYRG